MNIRYKSLLMNTRYRFYGSKIMIPNNFEYRENKKWEDMVSKFHRIATIHKKIKILVPVEALIETRLNKCNQRVERVREN